MYINMFFRNTIDWIFNYLCHPFIISDQLTAIVQREKRLTFLAGFILIISNIGKNTVPCKISGLFVNERKNLGKIGKQMVRVRSRYFHLAFERIFSDFPFSRSLRHKNGIFYAYA